MTRRLSPVAILVLLAAPAAAQNPHAGWIVDQRTGCRVWDPDPQPEETISWSGDCVDGLASGSGILQWYGKGGPIERYEGDYRDGKADGHGVWISAKGNRYEGEYRDGKRDGHGVHTWNNGARYEGSYVDGKENGYGVVVWAGGARFEGEWRDGRPNGPGTFIEQRRTFTGIWQNGCLHDGERRIEVGPGVETEPNSPCQ